MNYRVYEFGTFRLCTESERLFVGEVEVLLGNRALRLLALLVGQQGGVVRHSELISCAWPDTVVENNNLRVQITMIRKALRAYEPGVTYIRNVAGRGYRFIREEVGQPTDSSTRSAVRPDLSDRVEPAKPTLPPPGTLSKRRYRRVVHMVREGAIERARRCRIPREELQRGASRTPYHLGRRFGRHSGREAQPTEINFPRQATTDRVTARFQPRHANPATVFPPAGSYHTPTRDLRGLRPADCQASATTSGSDCCELCAPGAGD